MINIALILGGLGVFFAALTPIAFNCGGVGAEEAAEKSAATAAVLFVLAIVIAYFAW